MFSIHKSSIRYNNKSYDNENNKKKQAKIKKNSREESVEVIKTIGFSLKNSSMIH